MTHIQCKIWFEVVSPMIGNILLTIAEIVIGSGKERVRCTRKSEQNWLSTFIQKVIEIMSSTLLCWRSNAVRWPTCDWTVRKGRQMQTLRPRHITLHCLGVHVPYVFVGSTGGQLVRGTIFSEIKISNEVRFFLSFYRLFPLYWQ